MFHKFNFLPVYLGLFWLLISSEAFSVFTEVLAKFRREVTRKVPKSFCPRLGEGCQLGRSSDP